MIGVLAAKTYGELERVTRDLPRLPQGQVNLLSIMGGDELDLRDAEIGDGEVTLNAISIMGGSTRYLLDTVNVEVEGFTLMGGDAGLGVGPRPLPGAPTVRIRTYDLMGGCTIWRLPAQARDLSLKDARRMAKSSRRGELGGGPVSQMPASRGRGSLPRARSLIAI